MNMIGSSNDVFYYTMYNVRFGLAKVRLLYMLLMCFRPYMSKYIVRMLDKGYPVEENELIHTIVRDKLPMFIRIVILLNFKNMTVHFYDLLSF